MRFFRFFWRVLAVLLVLAIVAAAIGWALRKDIARNYADAEIKRRGIPARYEITELGPSRQRLERISLGDPANPDLTADWAEIITTTRFSGVSVQMVRAGGVRLKGRLVDGRAQFGVLDALIPPPSATHFALPDFRVDLADARVSLDTPYGRVGARFDGRGNIATSLKGKLAAVMPNGVLGTKCGARGLTAYFNVSTDARRISAKGPVRASAANCAGIDAAFPQVQLDLVTDERFARIDSDVAVETGALRFAGSAVRTARATARLTWANGAFKSDGNGAVTGLSPDARLIDRAVLLARRGDGTPVAALGGSLVRAIQGLKRGGNAQARFSVKGNASAGKVKLDAVSAQSVSGAVLRLAQASSISVGWPDRRASVDGAVQLAGGGFPATNIRFDQGRGGLLGSATIAPLATGRTRLALAPVRFDFRQSGTRIETVALFDGPLGGGQVRGLIVPLSLRGGALVGECRAVGIQRYSYAKLSVAPVRTSICVRGGEASVGALRLAGRLGANPLSLEVQSARYALADGKFSAAGLIVRLGDAAQLSKMDIPRLSGTLKNGTANGVFSGATGQIGTVALRLSEIGGDWAFAKQILMLKGGLRVADAAAAPRYLPLVSDDFTLRLGDNKISAAGTLREPFSKTPVTGVSITHDLGTAVGGATLDVPALSFGDSFQPERLTSITLGVIANVRGTIAGRGDIRWNGSTVTSSGAFRTDALDFAAAFGPVTGFKGEIALSDLLGLATPPGQSVTIASINPGIAVTDGAIKYRLLPGLKLEIEGGRWPFAGGELILKPSILDLNQAAERRLTFRVQGLDAALFVQQLAFDNIAVTGKFDGLLPMVFDQAGGRIEGGNLTVRDGGGTLSYVGDVSNAELGRFSKLAFDALKSIRYKKLTLELNGALDGEMVTVVRFNGVNQLPLAQTKNFFLKQFNQIPFLFNITIKAPFRGLFSMVRSFNDPSVFIPRGLQPVPEPPAPPKPVQTKESETVQ